MSFGLDEGSEGSQGPWIGWTGEGAKDRSIAPDSFFIRGEEGQQGRTKIDSFDKGVVIDIHSLRTGWNFTTGIAGQAPEWKWNASYKKMEKRPDDVEMGGKSMRWKKGFSMMCAIGGGKVANWEQSGQGAWDGMSHLVSLLADGPVDDKAKLPLVKFVKSEVTKYTRGSSIAPILEVVKWVDRPDCLADDTGFSSPDSGDGVEADARQEKESADSNDELAF